VIAGGTRAAEVARELTRRRADLVDHARGSLEQHLLGVHGVLARWGRPERVQLAGLLHSAYSTEAYGARLFGRADRPRVRELIGADAERLVFAFCACPRSALLAAAEEAGYEPVSLASRWKGVTVEIGRRDLAELLVIHAANLAEQVCLPRGGPTRWLAAASRLLATARPTIGTALPVFDGGGVVTTGDEETLLLRTYRASLLPSGASNRLAGAKRVLRSSPVGEPLVVAGFRELAARRGGDAAALGARALAAFDTWGVPWDKRLRLVRWQQLAELLVAAPRMRRLG
jgi:uncharacterized protein DUF6817